ncbi:MAG: BLUF domain-containing protein [Pseudomonadota bacterium]
MKRIIYKSRAKAWVSASDLAALLSVSRRNNLKRGLTGLLVYSRGNFLQVLEGPQRSVDATFDRILADPRHTSCEIIREEQIYEPDFGDWLMGFWSDEISTAQRASGMVSVTNLLEEFNSEWLEGKSQLNELLFDEIFKLRVETAA